MVKVYRHQCNLVVIDTIDTFPLGVLSASQENDLITVYKDMILHQGNIYKVIADLHYSNFRDHNNSPFASAADTVAYLNQAFAPCTQTQSIEWNTNKW
ncbi:MAG: hypothetical protein AAF599_09685 [Bacteroidota bacterium]